MFHVILANHHIGTKLGYCGVERKSTQTIVVEASEFQCLDSVLHACKTQTMRMTFQSCSGNGSLTIKLMIEKEKKEKAREGILAFVFKRESQLCLLIREGMSLFIVKLNVCENTATVISTSR